MGSECLWIIILSYMGMTATMFAYTVVALIKEEHPLGHRMTLIVITSLCSAISVVGTMELARIT